MDKVIKSDAQWQWELTPEQYDVLRNKSTEKPYSGKDLRIDSDGMYACAACGQKLFAVKDKFESGTGWPSFTCPVEEGVVELKRDVSHGMERTEVLCARCGGHLGHVFDDGPGEDGKRFCINSLSLDTEELGDEST